MEAYTPGPWRDLGARVRGLVESPGDVLVLVVSALFVLGWALRAWLDRTPADFFVAYVAGQVSWSTGHPEVLRTWTGTPLYAVSMLGVYKSVNLYLGAHLLTLLNIVAFVGATVVLLGGLRRRLPRWAWWLLALALCSFAPVLETVWWKQINLISLVSAAGGYALLRRRRSGWGAALIGFSVAFKPLAVLLPFALLLRRETRRAGLIALGWVVALSMLALAVLAWRAHSAAVLNPYPVYENFAAKLRPQIGYSCYAGNYAPTSVLCQLAGGSALGTFRIAVLLGSALITAWVLEALRDRGTPSWDAFAFACLISLVVSPISWTHYQVMLIPLFVVLLVHFSTRGASPSLWIGLIVAYLLCSLVWQPYGTLLHNLHSFLSTGRVHNTYVLGAPGLNATEDLSQLAQYVLLITGLLWYWRDVAARPRPPAAAGASAAS